MNFDGSLIFPQKLLSGYIIFGSIVETDLHTDPASPYYGFPYRWSVTLNTFPQQHSNPNTTTHYIYNKGRRQNKVEIVGTSLSNGSLDVDFGSAPIYIGDPYCLTYGHTGMVDPGSLLL